MKRFALVIAILSMLLVALLSGTPGRASLISAARAMGLGAPAPANPYDYGRGSLGPEPLAAVELLSTPCIPTYTTVVLQQGRSGYTGAEDTYISKYAETSGYYNLTLRVGYQQQNATLLRFDLSVIPTGATVTKATLEFYVTGWGGTSTPSTGSYAILRSTTLSQATWYQAQVSNLWGSAGCNDIATDRRGSPESTVTVNDVLSWYAFDLTSLVQSWVNGDLLNNGVLVRAETSDPVSFYFASAEYGDVELRPKLAVTYSDCGSAPTATPTHTQPPAETATPTPSATRTETRTPTLTPTFGGATYTVTPSRTPTAATGPTRVITLQQGTNGYSGAEDTYIHQYQDEADTSRYSSATLQVGDKQRAAAVLRFDVSPIPTDATILDATLGLYARGWSGEGAVINFGPYAILRSTTLSQVTWYQAQVGNPWGIAGCNNTATDRRPSPESSLTAAGTQTWYTFGLTNLVQAWVNGSTPNHGVLLRASDPYSVASYYFAAAEHAIIGERPRLVITYVSSSMPTPTLGSTPTTIPTRTPTRSPTPTATPTPTQDPNYTPPPPTPSRTRTPTSSATATYTPTPIRTIAPTGVITLQHGVNGYFGGEDTYIDANDANATQYYNYTLLKVGYKQKYAALLRFDLSPIPVGASITRVTLQLFAKGWSGANIALDTHAISRTVTLSQSTWTQAQNGNAWGSPGCNDTFTDRRLNPESSLITADPGVWYSFDLTSLARTWYNGSVPNNGILLRGRSGWVEDHFYFCSAEYTESGLRPRLVVQYEGGGSPTPGATPTFVQTTTPTYVPTPTQTATTTAPPNTDITVTLQQGLNGYSGAEDATIDRYNANASYYRDAALKVGQKQQYAALLRFDLSSIPSNAIITRATLHIYGFSWGLTDVGMGAYAVLRTTNLSQATWYQAQVGNPWAVGGCDGTHTDRRAEYESGAITTGGGMWSRFAVTSVVQEWVSGSLANNGLLLRAMWLKYTDGFSFASSEFPDVASRPQLVVTYYIPDGPPRAPSLVIGHVTDIHVGGTAVGPLLGVALQTMSEQAQVIVDTGDCTQDGTADQSVAYWELISASTYIPWRAVQGNHDTSDVFSTYIGPLEWSWDVGDYRLIGINIRSINFTALDQALTTDKICIIFGHYPIGWYSAADQAALRQRFRTYHVPLYVAGHLHYPDSLELDPESGTLLLIGLYGSQGHYRLITMRGSEVSVAFH